MLQEKIDQFSRLLAQIQAEHQSEIDGDLTDYFFLTYEYEIAKIVWIRPLRPEVKQKVSFLANGLK